MGQYDPWGSNTRHRERWSVCPRCFVESVLTRPSPRCSSVARGYLPVFAMLPSIMSVAYPGENPSTVRMGAAIPIVALLMATALNAVLARLWSWVGVGPPNPARLAVPSVTIGSLLKAQKSSSNIGFGSLLVGVFAIAVIGSIWKSNLEAYFTAYPAQHTLSSQHASRFGDVIKGFEAFGGLRDDAFILPGPYWVDWRLMAIEAGDIKWRPSSRMSQPCAHARWTTWQAPVHRSPRGSDLT